MTQLLEHKPDSGFDHVPLLTSGAILQRAVGIARDVPSLPAQPADGEAARNTAPGPDPGKPPRRRGFARTVKAGFAGLALLLALAVVTAAAVFLTFPRLMPSAWTATLGHLGQHDLSWLIPADAFLALVAAVAAWRLVRHLVRGRRAADVLTVLAASVASVVSATGMWRVFTDILHFDTTLRALLFPFIEIAVITSAVRARDNMREAARARKAARESGSEADAEPRGIDVDSMAMWTLTCLSAVLSSLAARSAAEAIFRLAPPLVAAWLWERSLVSERRRIEFRRRITDKQIQWRLTLERLLVRLGVAEPTGRAIGDVAAQRRITQLALAAERAAGLDAAGASGRRRSRADRRLRTTLRMAVEHAGLATDEQRQRELIDQLAILRGYKELTKLVPAAPWAQINAGRLPPAGPPKDEDRQDHDREQDEQRDKRDRRDDERQDDTGRSPGNGAFTRLAEELTRSLRQGNDGGPARIHSLLSGRDDYQDLVGWLGNRAKFGDKRLMALIGLYAVGDLASPGAVSNWIASLVPGKPGHVEKADIRRVRDRIAPEWRTHTAPAHTTGGDEDNEMESR